MLGRFISADSIVPGAADGSGGGAGTLGVDSGSRLTTLTTDFHEFIGQVTTENQAVLQYGPFFQWSEKVRRDNPVPSGPLNPQALNRYAYVLNNPLRYVDPTGHDQITVSKDQLQTLFDKLNELAPYLENGVAVGTGIGVAGLGLSGIPIVGIPVGAVGGIIAAVEGARLADLHWLQTRIMEAMEVADNNGGFVTIQMSHADSFGTLLDFGCVGCSKITMVVDHAGLAGRSYVAEIAWKWLDEIFAMQINTILGAKATTPTQSMCQNCRAPSSLTIR